MNDDDKARALAAQVAGASRRRVLCGVMGASATALLTAAACGNGDDAGGNGSGSEDGGDGSDSEDGGDENGPLAQLDDIPVGGGIVAAGLVLVQPEEGEVRAFDASCPHQGTEVEPPDGDGVIVCPNHGSQFAYADGDLLEGPAETGLSEVDVEVSDGEVHRA